MTKYIDIKRTLCSGSQRTEAGIVSLAIRNNEITVLGAIPHGTVIALDSENAHKLINVLKQFVAD